MNTILSKDILLDLLSNNKTPFYFYSKRILRQTINEILDAFSMEDFQLLFATMANDNIEFLKTVKEMQVGVCINSVKHLELVHECGFKNENIQFTSTGLSKDDMKLLLENGITTNIDSLSQLEQWFSIGGKVCAGIRINSDSLTDTIFLKDRLGIEKVEINEAIKISKKFGGFLNGIHIYIGTNYKNHKELLHTLIPFFDLASKITDLEYVNIGGGVGVNYHRDSEEFNLIEYGRNVGNYILNLRNKLNKNIKIFFEPGRRLAASSGGFITKITDIKYLKKIRYIVVDASVAVFPRPLHHPESPHSLIIPFKEPSDRCYEESIVVGKTTFSNDIMSKMNLPLNLEIGDVIIFDKAGAYCDSMRSKFLGQFEPQNIFVDG